MEKKYTSKGFELTDRWGKKTFCPKENIIKTLENQKRLREHIDKNIERLQNDLNEIGKL